MLKLCNIVKHYQTSTTTVQALKGVTLSFREHEFVAILGPSGCGKTTMLNIIGGLDRYTSGDLVIGGVSTADFDDEHWDAYRNATIGFVFQSYNLIPHLTVLENVELALSLTGVKKKERRARSVDALKKVNMEDEINKRPNQLSGGQMQRVAIARAIVNDPKIILADEPTGALDSELSVQVMDILRQISQNRLVIMVTHNEDLANTYCSRICRFKDGLLMGDTNPYNDEDEASERATSQPAEKQTIEKQTSLDDSITTDISTLADEQADISQSKNEQIQDTAVDGKQGEIAVDDKTNVAREQSAEEIEIDLSKSKKKHSNHKRKVAMKHIDVAKKANLDKLGIQTKKEKKKAAKARISRKDKAFKPTAMNAGTAFGLSLRNLVSKRRRSFLTAFAGSIGIIGLALVLSISNGFNIFIEDMQTEMLAGVPIGIYQYNINDSAIMDTMMNMAKPNENVGDFPDDDDISVKQGSSTADGAGFITSMMTAFFDGVTKNDLSPEFADYMAQMPKENYSAMSIYYGLRYNLVTRMADEDGNLVYKDISKSPKSLGAMDIATTVLGENGMQSSLWQVLVGDEQNMLKSYSLIGENSRYPQNKNEIVLCISEGNQITQELLDSFGIDGYQRDEQGNLILGEDGKPKKVENYDVNYFIGKTIKLAGNDSYYDYDEEIDFYDFSNMEYDSNAYWRINNQEKLEQVYNDGEELTIVGVIRPKKRGNKYVGTSSICYTQALAEYVLDKAYNSVVSARQREYSDVNAGSGVNLFGEYVSNTEITSNPSIIGVTTAKLNYTSYLRAIGAIKSPTFVTVYPETYSQKEAVCDYIKDWRSADNRAVGYLDVSSMFIYNLQVIIDLVSVMLIVVASISLVVSTVMIGVITSNSVIERTREIGILRSIGARKRDIRNVFVAETSILGLSSGLLGIGISYVLCPIISAVINAIAGFPSLLHFHPLHALLLVVLSLVLTIISGIIPAINASRKNMVDALRVE